MTLSITSCFDGGAIEIVSAERAGDVRLRVRADSHADFAQWFYFRVNGARDEECRFVFENAGQCAFADGFHGYQAVASYDKLEWFRVPTTYDGQLLTIEHVPEFDTVYYAYFEPYDESRHDVVLGQLQRHPAVRLIDLGRTIEGRPIELLTLGDGDPAKPKIWIIARQHPGETMAEWFVEGLLGRLAAQGDWSGEDTLGGDLLARATFYIVPNMNPDGSALGNLRTNATGANLNREWMNPTLAHSPEVKHVRDAMHRVGVDMFFDIHGDETLPYVFVAGSEMLPDFTEQQGREQRAFIEFFKDVAPDFQDVHGYQADKYREDALSLASKYAGHAFNCLSLTLEMPFKDNANQPDPEVGWNGARSAALGAALLEAIEMQLDAFPRTAR
jgi:murein tripeptide amidase MpaA